MSRSGPDDRPTTTVRDAVPLREATRAWFLISLQTFGGPAGQIAVMQRTLVDERRWIGQQRFLFALSFCTLLPGPEAQQLATYVGWLLNGVKGALAAGTLFVLPGAVTLLVLSGVYVAYGDTRAVDALFLGLAPAVVAIVAQAVWRLSRRGLPHPALVAVAITSFIVLTATDVPFPAVVLAAAAVGWGLGRVVPGLGTPSAVAADAGPAPVVGDDALRVSRPSARRTATVLVVGLLAWMTPVALAATLLGPSSTLAQQGTFFSGAALVTFGGAYAVLAFVAQQAVATYGWLAPGEMVRGLALAETTPGPLVMVVQFVAFLGAFRSPDGLDPWVAAVLAAVLTTWVTFVPSFLFILLGAPYVERLRGNRALTSALSGVTAAVVGVIGSLAVYFAVHTLFGETGRLTAGPIDLEHPVLGTLRPVAAAIAGLGAVLLLWRGWSVLRTLGVCAAVGLVVGLVS